MLLVVAELPFDAGVITERYNGVNTLACVSSGLDRRNAFAENLGVKVLVLLHPCARLLRCASIGGTRLALVGQQAERPSRSGAMAGKTENDRRLVRAIKGSEEMPTGIGNDLRQLGRNTRTRGRRDLRQSLAAASGGKT